MSLPAVVGLIKHQLMWVVSGEFWVTTLWVQHAGAATQAMADADQAVISNWATATWRPQADNQAALRQVKSYNFGTTPPTPFTPLNLYPLSTITGALGISDMIPPWVTLAISLRTGNIADNPKPPSGRIYHVGGIARSSLNSTEFNVDSGTATAKINVWSALNTAFTNTGNIGDWVVMSWYSGGTREAPVLRPSPLSLPVARLYASTRLAYIGKRRPRQQSFTTN
jgi:hypothetical protein